MHKQPPAHCFTLIHYPVLSSPSHRKSQDAASLYLGWVEGASGCPTPPPRWMCSGYASSHHVMLETSCHAHLPQHSPHCGPPPTPQRHGCCNRWRRALQGSWYCDDSHHDLYLREHREHHHTTNYRADRLSVTHTIEPSDLSTPAQYSTH